MKRFSILKPQKEQPDVPADEKETEAILSRSRRVSFAASNFIKPFVIDAQENTVWDSTYEEINHTDSTVHSNGSSGSNSQSQTSYNKTMPSNNQTMPISEVTCSSWDMDLTNAVMYPSKPAGNFVKTDLSNFNISGLDSKESTISATTLNDTALPGLTFLQGDEDGKFEEVSDLDLSLTMPINIRLVKTEGSVKKYKFLKQPSSEVDNRRTIHFRGSEGDMDLTIPHEEREVSVGSKDLNQSNDAVDVGLSRGNFEVFEESAFQENELASHFKPIDVYKMSKEFGNSSKKRAHIEIFEESSASNNRKINLPIIFQNLDPYEANKENIVAYEPDIAKIIDKDIKMFRKIDIFEDSTADIKSTGVRNSINVNAEKADMKLSGAIPLHPILSKNKANEIEIFEDSTADIKYASNRKTIHFNPDEGDMELTARISPNLLVESFKIPEVSGNIQFSKADSDRDTPPEFAKIDKKLGNIEIFEDSTAIKPTINRKTIHFNTNDADSDMELTTTIPPHLNFQNDDKENQLPKQYNKATATPESIKILEESFVDIQNPDIDEIPAKIASNLLVGFKIPETPSNVQFIKADSDRRTIHFNQQEADADMDLTISNLDESLRSDLNQSNRERNITAEVLEEPSADIKPTSNRQTNKFNAYVGDVEFTKTTSQCLDFQNVDKGNKSAQQFIKTSKNIQISEESFVDIKNAGGRKQIQFNPHEADMEIYAKIFPNLIFDNFKIPEITSNIKFTKADSDSRTIHEHQEDKREDMDPKHLNPNESLLSDLNQSEREMNISPAFASTSKNAGIRNIFQEPSSDIKSTSNRNTIHFNTHDAASDMELTRTIPHCLDFQNVNKENKLAQQYTKAVKSSQNFKIFEESFVDIENAGGRKNIHFDPNEVDKEISAKCSEITASIQFCKTDSDRRTIHFNQGDKGEDMDLTISNPNESWRSEINMPRETFGVTTKNLGLEIFEKPDDIKPTNNRKTIHFHSNDAASDMDLTTTILHYLDFSNIDKENKLAKATKAPEHIKIFEDSLLDVKSAGKHMHFNPNDAAMQTSAKPSPNLDVENFKIPEINSKIQFTKAGSDRRTIHFNKEDEGEDMDLTNANPNESFLSDFNQSNREDRKNLPAGSATTSKTSGIIKVFEERSAEITPPISSRKTIYFTAKDGDMEFTGAIPQCVDFENVDKENELAKHHNIASHTPKNIVIYEESFTDVKKASGRKTIHFNEAAADMDLTAGISSNIHVKNYNFPQTATSITDFTKTGRETSNSNQENADVELKTTISQNFNKENELANDSKLTADIESTTSSRKTIHFNSEDANMELTCTIPQYLKFQILPKPSEKFDIVEECSANIQTADINFKANETDISPNLQNDKLLCPETYSVGSQLNQAPFGRRTIHFNQEDADMELTTSIPQNIQFQNVNKCPTNFSQSQEKLTKTSIERSSIHLNSEEADIELTASPNLKTPLSTNFDKTIHFNDQDGDMDLSTSISENLTENSCEPSLEFVKPTLDVTKFSVSSTARLDSPNSPQKLEESNISSNSETDSEIVSNNDMKNTDAFSQHANIVMEAKKLLDEFNTKLNTSMNLFAEINANVTSNQASIPNDITIDEVPIKRRRNTIFVRNHTLLEEESIQEVRSNKTDDGLEQSNLPEIRDNSLKRKSNVLTPLLNPATQKKRESHRAVENLSDVFEELACNTVACAISNESIIYEINDTTLESEVFENNTSKRKESVLTPLRTFEEKKSRRCDVKYEKFVPIDRREIYASISKQQTQLRELHENCREQCKAYVVRQRENRKICQQIKTDCEDKKETVPSIEMLIKEKAEASKVHWKFVKIEDENFYFTIMESSGSLMIGCDKEVVKKVDVKINYIDEREGFHKYLVGFMEERTKRRILEGALRGNLNVLSVLDYFGTIMHDLFVINEEWDSLASFYPLIDLDIKDNFRVCFKVVHISSKTYWQISVGLILNNFVIDTEDIQIVNHAKGLQCNEVIVKDLAKNIERNVQSLRRFIELVLSYHKRIAGIIV